MHTHLGPTCLLCRLQDRQTRLFTVAVVAFGLVLAAALLGLLD